MSLIFYFGINSHNFFVSNTTCFRPSKPQPHRMALVWWKWHEHLAWPSQCLDFCGTHKDARPFCNQGWVHFERMSEIMPVTVCSVNIFCPSQGLTGLHWGYDYDSTPDAATQVLLRILKVVWQTRPPGDVTGECHHSLYIRCTNLLFSSFLLPHHPLHGLLPLHLASASVLSLKPHHLWRKSRPLVPRLIGLTQSISHFGDKICQVLAMDPSLWTPHFRKEALKLAQQEEFSKGDQLIFYSVLERDINAVHAYASIDYDDQEFCEMWVCDKVTMEKDCPLKTVDTCLSFFWYPLLDLLFTM